MGSQCIFGMIVALAPSLKTLFLRDYSSLALSAAIELLDFVREHKIRP